MVDPKLKGLCNKILYIFASKRYLEIVHSSRMFLNTKRAFEIFPYNPSLQLINFYVKSLFRINFHCEALKTRSYCHIKVHSLQA